ncbi:hypothetical protein [Polaromonas sp. AER18D-145]|uniref:hypothetical protein n=1 Tax=Polaromonas sp. AER18D-145 TaxID=1977060 RepID=UPI001144E33F|nr:hypothetical protein [Polaromonas sp. AER18D-145]
MQLLPAPPIRVLKAFWPSALDGRALAAIKNEANFVPFPSGKETGRFAPLLQVVAVQQNTAFSRLGVCADLPSAGRGAK